MSPPTDPGIGMSICQLRLPTVQLGGGRPQNAIGNLHVQLRNSEREGPFFTLDPPFFLI